MPLFRRRSAPPSEVISVGVQGHRVVLNSPAPGIDQLDGLGDYVEAISRRRPPGPDGRDAIAVLNAKMDHAESVNDLVAAATLCFEELVERGVIAPDEAPAPPPTAPVRRDLTTYEYIQQLHARAVERRRWLDRADVRLRECGVALLGPPPIED
ncbi:MAG: hypothetical protein ACYDAC_03795 [Candidatus Dormibacteria bacterium]